MKSFKKGLPFLLSLLAIVLVVFLLFTKPQNQTVISNDQISEVFAPTLTVEPQLPSDSIFVTNAVLDKPGFIAVFKTMDKTVPDETNFSGVSGLLEGDQEVVQVPLTTPSIEGDTYSVIIHVDDGDGIFEFPGDDMPSAFADGTVNYIRTTIATPSAPLQN